MKNFTLRLADQEYSILDKEAQKTERNKNDILREFIRTLPSRPQASSSPRKLTRTDVAEVNPITKYMIKEVLNLLDYEDDFSWRDDETDADICKSLVDMWLQQEYDECLEAIHENMDGLNNVPVDFIPKRLFRAAIESAIPTIDWEIVASNPDIKQRIEELRQA